jgi:hypothetical protein
LYLDDSAEEIVHIVLLVRRTFAQTG